MKPVFISIALNNPLPLTSFTICFGKVFNLDLIISPNFNAFCGRFSSMITSSAAMPTLHPKGFPPNVDPWEP